ncbi:MAG: MFS transporter [Bacteroidales bacterium]
MTPEPSGRCLSRPKFFYGWAVAGAGFAVAFMALGTRLSFGVFFTSLELEFNLNRTMTSGIFSIYMMLCCAVSIGGGWVSDRWGPRAVTALMGVFTAASLILTAVAWRGWHLLFTYGLLLALGTGAVFTVVNATASRWFVRKRGLAVGITSSGGGVGAIFIVPLSAMLISRFNWRISLWVLGIVAGLVMVSMALVLRSSPEAMGLRPDGDVDVPKENPGSRMAQSGEPQGMSPAEALRRKDFWLLFGNWLLLSFAVHLRKC